MNKRSLAKALEIAWRRYTKTFGAPPHGTYRQLRALLELCPNIGLIEDEDVKREV